jgi:hypothetical protein
VNAISAGGGAGDVMRVVRSLLVSLCVVAGALLTLGAPAFAAAPEAPETKPATAIGATTATVHGVLDPSAASSALMVEYLFVYAPRRVTSCEELYVAAPEPPAFALSAEGEAVEFALTGLEPNTQYGVCAAVRNAPGEAFVLSGNIETFTTLPAAPTVSGESESVSERTPASARLNAAVDPNNEATKCLFQYGQASVSENEVACEGAPLNGGQQGASAAIAGLGPGETYHYRVLVENATGKAQGEEAKFTAAVPPETPEAQADAAEPVSGTVEKLKGVLNPAREGEAGSYEFLYKQSETECEGGTATPAEPSTGAHPEPVSAEAIGLLPHTTYTFCLRAHNHAEPEESATGLPTTFTTTANPPTISGESALEVGSTEATVQAEIDPGGSPTGYRVQYVSDVQFKESGFSSPGEAPAPPAPEANLGGASTAAVVQQQLAGLRAGELYHFRFLARNEVDTTGVPGEAATFATVPAAAPALTLPDDRAYELVSSPTSNANVYFPEGSENSTASLARAAAGGDAVVYQADPPAGTTEGGSGNTGPTLGNAYIAERAAGGWKDTDLQLLPGTRYEGFSNELSIGVLNPLLFGVAEEVPRADSLLGAPSGCSGLFFYSSSDSDYQSLGCNNGGEFAGGNSGTPTVPTYSDILFRSQSVLTPEALEPNQAEHEKVLGEFNLYDAVSGQVHLVSVRPDGEATLASDFVGNYGYSQGENSVASGKQGSPYDISADGSYVFWEENEWIGGEVRRPKALFARENPSQPQSGLVPGSTKVDGEQCSEPTRACTVQIDAKQEGAEGESGLGLFRAASSAGSKVFFTDCNRLTVGSTAVPSEACETGNDLYEYDFESRRGQRLTDLTVDNSENANVQGVLGSSEDGSYVYFVAAGVLASNKNSRSETAVPQTCSAPTRRNPEGGLCNLYLQHDGVTTFIAVLLYRDSSDWGIGIDGHDAEATPDGHNLLFRSAAKLTGYDSGGLPEVFVYNADTGRLSCASCDPVGLLPSPDVSDLRQEGSRRYGEGGSLPSSNNEDFMLRWISEDGARVFFDTAQPLVPQDINGLRDVYEWERPAAAGEQSNTCTRSSPSFSEVNAGCVYLLSGGTSTDDSTLLDASANGNNVFVRIRAKLVQAAVNENMALYDVRVDGGFPEPELACTGTGCQGVPPTAPIFATPSSVTFNGVGNFPSGSPPPVVKRKPKPAKCRKGFAKRKAKCVRSKKRAKRAEKPSRRGRR